MAAHAHHDHSAHAAAALEAEDIAPQDDERVPVTVLTGFLGSGKTTVLNHILTAKHGQRIAVIENEFGAVGIDDKLLAQNMKEYTEDEIIETINGCICCNVRGDLIATLERIAERMHGGGGLKLDAVVIETTGMADPSPVAQTFFADEVVQENYRLDGIVTVVDAKHVEQHLDEKKADGAINETVQQLAFADRIILNKIDLVPEAADRARIEQRLRSINAFAPLAMSQRGVVAIDSVLGIRAFDLKKALSDNPAFLDKTKSTHHEGEVSSFALNVPGSVDLTAIRAWINELLEENGDHLYRMKGILSIESCEDRYVYHGVHMLFDGRFTDPWGAEERCCKLVFIGKGLDKAALEASFNECLDTEENRAKRAAQLRFKIGEAVECNSREGWVPGKIVAFWFRHPNMPPGMRAPYQIELENGHLIFAPADDERCIRAQGSSLERFLDHHDDESGERHRSRSRDSEDLEEPIVEDA